MFYSWSLLARFEVKCVISVAPKRIPKAFIISSCAIPRMFFLPGLTDQCLDPGTNESEFLNLILMTLFPISVPQDISSEFELI